MFWINSVNSKDFNFPSSCVSRSGSYHSTSKKQVRYTIIKLTPIHASLIFHEFAEFIEFLFHLGKTSIVFFPHVTKFTWPRTDPNCFFSCQLLYKLHKIFFLCLCQAVIVFMHWRFYPIRLIHVDLIKQGSPHFEKKIDWRFLREQILNGTK